MLVYTCTQGDEGTMDPVGSPPVPTCESGGAWVQVEAYSPEEFDIASLEVSRLQDAFAAGFLVVATGLLIVLSIKIIIRSVRTLW